ncbi:MAG: hypothetical protein AAB638_02030 [Patescibacteria group bacterium]
MGVSKFELSHGEKLKVIENFSVRLAQALVGGTVTEPNHPYGDLIHSDGTFSEVKAAGVSSGAIIRREQLRRHSKGPTRDYILVFKSNRVWENGRWLYLTCRNGRSRQQLERICLESVVQIMIVPTAGMATLYKNMKRRAERTYHFKAGPKTYVKMRVGCFNRLILSGYTVSSNTQLIKLGSERVSVSVTVINPN